MYAGGGVIDIGDDDLYETLRRECGILSMCHLDGGLIVVAEIEVPDGTLDLYAFVSSLPADGVYGGDGVLLDVRIGLVHVVVDDPDLLVVGDPQEPYGDDVGDPLLGRGGEGEVFEVGLVVLEEGLDLRRDHCHNRTNDVSEYTGFR